ncbi:class Ib ribonucleoside-diphosphate reductase assembly flavoprotein NrdI [Streptococcus didelphis]|uniref:Protein NrdI n=2 Tax=Streptococcus didelphis TaxID=102886 RepID=A0ABY9LJ35_9STRE|nr:class Ib ribonucleoside-diphosphate reductase assembly flavoprotein NrdI [Streptococcus didelphis]WMB28810.1 class Ib ribonucleoside-diphosphate reductase assembly flavoprotein NrdI [Streptococcus didelphis]WMB30153.1 class Ib ribonucleoside-diphosphate reductase assembly flavoprotein NrdI [Streptococcus didelphis]
MCRCVVYFSSKSNNTHRFVEKLACSSQRIPMDGTSIKAKEAYILIVPTYAGGGGKRQGAVPKQVIQFLNDPDNRKFCCGVIGTGNTNFGDTYALAGPIIAEKLGVPMLHQFELLGTKEDVKRVKEFLICPEERKD